MYIILKVQCKLFCLKATRIIYCREKKYFLTNKNIPIKNSDYVFINMFLKSIQDSIQIQKIYLNTFIKILNMFAFTANKNYSYYDNYKQ